MKQRSSTFTIMQDSELLALQQHAMSDHFIHYDTEQAPGDVMVYKSHVRVYLSFGEI